MCTHDAEKLAISVLEIYKEGYREERRHREKPARNQRKSKKGTKNLRHFFLTTSKPDASLVGCPKFQRAVKKEE